MFVKHRYGLPSVIMVLIRQQWEILVTLKQINKSAFVGLGFVKAVFCFSDRMWSQCSWLLECTCCCRAEEGTHLEFPLKEESAAFLSSEANIFVLKEGRGWRKSWNSPAQLWVIGLQAVWLHLPSVLEDNSSAWMVRSNSRVNFSGKKINYVCKKCCYWLPHGQRDLSLTSSTNQISRQNKTKK